MALYRLPNLFIIGAPKCGTTTLSHHLAMHPDIYMSETSGTKEPKHFSTDIQFDEEKNTVSRTEYLKLFKDAPGSATYLGEASTQYLMSKVAINNILKECHDPRFIVMLRNPIDLVISLHNHRVKRSCEKLDLETAWNLQEERLQGNFLPPIVTDGRILQYGEQALIGEQLQRLYQTVDHKNVHVIFYDDFKSDTRKAYLNVLNFLNLKDDGQTRFLQRNKSVTLRLPAIENILDRIRKWRKRHKVPGGLGIDAFIQKINRKAGKYESSQEFRSTLKTFFNDDIKLLERLTSRDLSHWK